MPMLSPRPACTGHFVFIFVSIYNGLSGARRLRGPESQQVANLASDDSQISGLAGRYATAAFELSLEEKTLEQVASDLAGLKRLLADSPDLARLVRSPVFSGSDQARALGAVLDQAKAGTLTKNLVLLLARKRRLFALNDVIRGFEALLARHRGEIAADVTTARPLSAEETAELRQTLKTKLGREPRLETHVDPTLLGGLVLKVGSRMIDSSVRTKLDALRAAMKGA